MLGFFGDKGNGRSFAVSGEPTGSGGLSESFEIRDGDLVGVSGFGFIIGATFISVFGVSTFIGNSTELAFFVGESGLGESNCGSPLLLLFGAS